MNRKNGYSTARITLPRFSAAPGARHHLVNDRDAAAWYALASGQDTLCAATSSAGTRAARLSCRMSWLFLRTGPCSRRP
jgi:hypothetical protein